MRCRRHRRAWRAGSDRLLQCTCKSKRGRFRKPRSSSSGSDDCAGRCDCVQQFRTAAHGGSAGDPDPFVHGTHRKMPLDASRPAAYRAAAGPARLHRMQLQNLLEGRSCLHADDHTPNGSASSSVAVARRSDNFLFIPRGLSCLTRPASEVLLIATPQKTFGVFPHTSTCRHR